MARSWVTSHPDRDMSGPAVHQPPLLQGAQGHHGAGDREPEAEDEGPRHLPAQQQPQPEPQQGREQDLGDGARADDRLHRQQVANREMQAHPEHQKDDPDLRQLRGEALIGDEAGGEGTDHDPGEKISGERRDAQAMGDDPEHEGQHDGADEGSDQRCVMRHAR